jgi:transcriptional regulator with XRE-family HTH domain
MLTAQSRSEDIIAAINAKGLSVSALAARAGLTCSRVWYLLKGGRTAKGSPTVDHDALIGLALTAGVLKPDPQLFPGR